MKESSKRYLTIGCIQASTVAIFLFVWQEFVVHGIINAYLFPAPLTIAEHFVSIARSNDVYPQVAVSVSYTLVTYVVAVFVGLTLGLIFGSSSFARRVSEPYLVLVNSTPKAIFLPVFYLALGAAFSYEFWFGFVSAVVPMTLNMTFAVATVPLPLLSAAKSMGASTRSVYLRVVIPGVIPTLLATARIVFSGAFAGILLAQEFAGTTGFGFLIVKFSGAFAMTQVYVVVIIASLIAITAFLLLLGMERYLTRWKMV
jgi:NitT/TauT family transport system permease protein